MEGTGLRIEGMRLLAVATGLAAYSSDGEDVFARAALKYWERAQRLMGNGSALPLAGQSNGAPALQALAGGIRGDYRAG